MQTTVDYLTVREVAQKLRLTEHTVRVWISAGKIKAIKPGLNYLIPANELNRILAGGK